LNFQNNFFLHGIGSLTFSDSEFTSEIMNTFQYFGRNPWMGDRPISRLLLTQNSRTEKIAGIYPYLRRDLNLWWQWLSAVWNPRSQC